MFGLRNRCSVIVDDFRRFLGVTHHHVVRHRTDEREWEGRVQILFELEAPSGASCFGARMFLVLHLGSLASLDRMTANLFMGRSTFVA